ncbi:MAG: DEAD/DEAH box helicase family protein [Paludibacteraceae bacterium]|nr:DEAD/DEAH box helicase family protein [Paludibacteraceae bacterium]
MELKPYQQQILDDLQRFMQSVQVTKKASEAFEHFWVNHPRTPLTPSIGEAVEPYKNNVIPAPHVCIKVPTGGGKTFIASAALGTIFSAFNASHFRTVVWLVPGITILEQTLRNLRNTNHPYRQRISTDFANRVEIFSKEQALQGAGFSLSVAKENLCILVMSFDSLRAKKKEDRKVYQENGNLQSFESIVGKDENGDADLQLMKVLQALNPVVVVDESHNAESELSVEMLQNLNPSFVLDLTATPRKNSNIISFTDAYELKKESMVKLPVIVYNHQSKNDVISSALELQRRLEQEALKAQDKGGSYIRPIVLFQAQPKTNDDNITFDKIKNTLLELKIPEEQIRIKTADRNEIKDEELLSPDCPVRYIITINALKEGWDCPFAYILASLADKSSSVDVEQILGRVLRMPWVRKNENPMLNMSYVLTASAKFIDTLDNIVKGLNHAGFSDNDYKVAEAEKNKEELTKTHQSEQGDLFASNTTITNPQSDSKNSNDDIDSSKIVFMPLVEEIKTQTTESTKEGENNELNPVNSDVDEIEKKVQQESKEEEKRQHEEASKTNVPTALNSQVKKYKMKDIFSESAKALKLPQFIGIDKSQELTSELFVELHQKAIFESESLLRDFKLGNEDSNIDFANAESSMYRIDLDDTSLKHLPTYLKVDGTAHERIVEYILDPSKKHLRLNNCTFRIKTIIGKMYPIPDKEIELFITHVLARFTDEQIADLMNHEYAYADKIKDKIKSLSNAYKEKLFNNMVDRDLIFIEETYQLPEEIIPAKTVSGLPKTLYEKEGDIDGFEKEVIIDVASLPNVEFWTRNLERGKGFFINGFINHYPDFIIKTKKGKIIMLETKGDHLDAEKKIALGNLWANKAGNSYKYCLVYKNRQVDGAYTKSEFLNLIKDL